MAEIAQLSVKQPEAKRENKASQMQKTGPSQSISSPVEQILFLQRTIGNQAVGRLIKSGALQAKLKIGQPGDIYEQEADRVAERVMRMPEPQVSNGTKVSNPAWNNSIQRKCPGCNKGNKVGKEEDEEKLQKKEASGSTHEVTPELESSISAVRGGGQPLPESVRAFYEPQFGADFSGVKVHTGSHAAETAKSINAKAFTVGQNVAFGEGQYAPESNAGRLLLAHELTHVVQQSPSPQSLILMRAPNTPTDMSNKPPVPKPGHTPFNFISESPALGNWKVSVKEMLEREFKTKFATFEEAQEHFRQYLRSLLSDSTREDFADRMRDRARKAFYRQEARNPSYSYDPEDIPRMRKGGAAPEGKMQLEHMQDVKTKIREGKLIQGHPERALDPTNIYITEGGPGGTAPLGTKHAEKQRTIEAAKKTSREIRDKTLKATEQAEHPNKPAENKTGTSGSEGTPSQLPEGSVFETKPILISVSNSVQAEIYRLNQLREVENTLTTYERFAESQYRRGPEFRQARERLERVLGMLRSPMITQASVLAAAQATRAPVESLLTLDFLAGVRELERTGPYYVTFEQEVLEARRTGRMSAKGIEALWELHPEAARKLLGQSGLSRRRQQEVARQLPGQSTPAPVMVRSIAGVLIAVEAVNLAAPIVQEVRAKYFGKHVKPALDDIMWWQDKGVFPAMEAVDDNFLVENEWTEVPKRIFEMLNDNEVSYLTLTGIPEDNWDRFGIWASAKLKNYRDWAWHILNTKAIRISGGKYMDQQTFEYRTSRVHGKTVGFGLEEIWYRNDRLDRILQAAARDVILNSNEQIGNAATKSSVPPSGIKELGSKAAIFENLPQATGKATFRPGADLVLYTLYQQLSRTGYGTEAVFYMFPSKSIIWDVPDGYVLVGGADLNTYAKVYATKNNIKEEVGGPYGGYRSKYLLPNTVELLLARRSDLVEIK